jgi:hypothetical protein
MRENTLKPRLYAGKAAFGVWALLNNEHGLLPSIVSAQRTRVCCSMSRADVQSRPSDVFLSSGFASYGYIAESQQSA